jgi:hypothetical protein
VKGQHHFFAMREDLVPGLEYIESQRRLEYHLYEMRADQEFVFLDSLLNAADLGISATGNTAQEKDYFVYPREGRPSIRSVPQRRGGTRYLLDPTPKTAHLRCGGLHEASGALIAGRVARGVQANAEGDALYKALSQGLLRGFNLVGSYWVGPAAYREFKAGRRLVTMGLRSPREYDLAEPES